MSSLAAGVLVIGLLALVGVPILWLIFRSGVQSPAERLAETREFERRLLNPNFAALERELGGPLPEALAALYADRDLVLGESWLFGVANPGQKGTESRVAFFQPADPASLRELGDGRAAHLAFANDGAGDEYLVDLREADPSVLYLQHDSGRLFRLSATLGEFLRLSRRPVPDE